MRLSGDVRIAGGLARLALEHLGLGDEMSS